MSQALKLFVMAAGALVTLSVPAFAQGAAGTSIAFSSAFGAGLVIMGAGYGIGKIGTAAVESMARQPEKAKDINQAMIVAAALIEGATFFALIVCMMSK